MYIKVTTFLSLLAAVSAAPASDLGTRALPKDTAFGFLALHSASPIHYQSLNADSGKIWIGKKTSTYCPLPPNNVQRAKSPPCPVDEKSKTSGPWNVFVDVKGKLKDKDVPTGCKKDCLGFTPAGGPIKDAVWQYA